MLSIDFLTIYAPNFIENTNILITLGNTSTDLEDLSGTPLQKSFFNLL